MIAAALDLFGPLALPECLRASRRGWVIWVRLLPAVGAGLVAFLVAWLWATFADLEPGHLPYQEIRGGLGMIVGALVVLAFLIPPAVLAGSLAGEKERGSIALLLSTQASAADIVLGRWVGRLAPVGLVGASALPFLFWLAALAGLGPGLTATCLFLPLMVGLGGGGFALGVSAVAKRGRDALLLVYLVDVGLMLGSVFGGGPAPAPPAGPGAGWADFRGAFGLGVFNPFAALEPLVAAERPAPALAAALAWGLLGLGGLVVASWRLRPSCLADGSGAGRKARRRRRVPPVGDRPMLWKELQIERAGSLGRVGRWVGGLLVAWLGLGSLILGALVLRDTYYPTATSGAGSTEPWAVTTLTEWYADPAWLISFLIQWAIALRAGVTIASERERGTWDALLTSPLEPAAIVLGKLWGSLHALRWLILAALTAWTVAWRADAMTTFDYTSTLADIATWGPLMAALGVAMSLRTATATKAMASTLSAWLVAQVATQLLAVFTCLGVMALCLTAWLTEVQAGLVGPNTSPWFPTTFGVGMEWASCLLTVGLTSAIVADTRIRFDRIAGRMTGGATAVRIDEFIHGRPMAPVRLGSSPAKKVAAPEV